MIDTNLIPLRQKILLGMTIFVGLVIFISYHFGLIEPSKLTMFVLFYSMVPAMSLLGFETLLDLDNNRIFYIWFTIGLIQFCIYLLTKDNLNFKILRGPNFDTNSLINNYVSDATTASLKTLLYFLIVYKLFNSIMKKLTGNYLLNTYKQMFWTHDTIRRKISGLDVVFNILLFAIILISAISR